MEQFVEEVEQKKKQTFDGLLFFLTGITLLSAGSASLLYGKEIHSFIKPYGLVMMLLFVLYIAVSLSKWKDVLLKPNTIKIAAGYMTGLVFVMLSARYPIYNFWLLGGAFVSILVNDYLGVAFQFIFSYLYCSLNGYNMELMLFYFILGTVICLLGKYMYKVEMMVYVTIIVLSCNIILLFIMNHFIFQKSFNENAAFSAVSTLAVLVTIYGTRKLWSYEKKELEEQSIQYSENQQIEDKKEAIELTKELWNIEEGKPVINNFEIENIERKPVMDNSEIENIAVSEIDKSQIKEFETEEFEEDIYDFILSENYELLEQLQKKSMTLFEHSKEVAELAVKGAGILGCNEKLVKAGGLYHEIGRLVNKEYIPSGVQLLQEHEFPAEVIDILKQQNSKMELPKSKEAAIVMLSESIVSTITYFEKEKKKAIKSGQTYQEQSLSKIVENIFNIRFSKGALDESGLTILEYKKLKHYYMEMYS